jgi:acetyl esterase/lipase
MNKRKRSAAAVVACLIAINGLAACATKPARLENRKLSRDDLDARVYKTAGGREIELHIFYPKGYTADSGARYPVALNFHGGGWSEGPIEWGHGDAQFMASLGFVGVAVGYRLALSDGATALDCIKDANSAVRWVRLNARELNADPDRVVAIGHSAGGHLALATAMFPALRESGEDAAVSSVPNAVVALAPAVDVGRDGYFKERLSGAARAIDCSPIDNVRPLGLPVLIIHGSADEVLPLAGVERFVSAMKDAGNDIELRVFPGGGHGFFYEDPVGRVFWQDAVREFVRGL